MGLSMMAPLYINTHEYAQHMDSEQRNIHRPTSSMGLWFVNKETPANGQETSHRKQYTPRE